MKPERERKPTRLKGFDYSSPGFYFITICTHQRICLFGDIANGKMKLNDIGKIVEEAWIELPEHYPNIQVKPFVLMPNHLHAIVQIEETESRGGFINPPLQKHGLTEIVRGFKTWSARKVNEHANSEGAPLWQRSFHNRIIRDENQLRMAAEYINYNPQRWEEDKEYLSVSFQKK